MFNVIPFRAARNLMNTSMDDMLSDRFFRHFFDMSDMVGTAGFPRRCEGTARCLCAGGRTAGRKAG